MVLVRAATIHDLPGVYRVCLLTGDGGKDGTRLFRDPDLLGQVYVGPYVIGSAELALVVVDDEGVAGYCLGAADTRAFEAWQEEAWWPALRAQHPLLADGSEDGAVTELIHRPAVAPDVVVAAYPAHLHIDLLERVRGLGLGRQLMEHQLATLAAAGVPGVHLDVALTNERARAFYRHLGFEDLLLLDDSVLMGRRLPG
jgi:ribosomal protein S18 acetylase RimI-like enzyme